MNGGRLMIGIGGMLMSSFIRNCISGSHEPYREIWRSSRPKAGFAFVGRVTGDSRKFFSVEAREVEGRLFRLKRPNFENVL